MLDDFGLMVDELVGMGCMLYKWLFDVELVDDCWIVDVVLYDVGFVECCV